MKRSIVLLAMAAGLSSVACGDVEDDCQTLCDYAEKCGVAIRHSCVEYCMEEYEDMNESCQDDMDDLFECVEKDDRCGAASPCGDKAVEIVSVCLPG